MPLIPVTLSEQLLYATTRMVVHLEDGEESIGTSFFFQYSIDEQHKLPVIITNKHVIEGGSRGLFYLHKRENIDDKAHPLGESFAVEIGDFENQWFLHPNEEVDLCAMPIQPIIEQAKSSGNIPYVVSLGEELILSDERLHELKAVEDILMVGYPIGLWDSVNNFPLIRRGITSSHPAIDFEGKSQMVVDIASFPGSSGSPVLIVNEGMYGTKTGTHVGSRGILLGVLFAGPQTTTDGEIVIEKIPTSKIPIAITAMMIHLGYVVKSKEILVLCEAMSNHYREQGRLL